MKIYYIYLKKDKRKGPRPIEAIAQTEEDKNNIVQYLLDKSLDVEVKERDAESFDEYKNRIEQTNEKEKLVASVKAKLTPEELEAIIASTKEWISADAATKPLSMVSCSVVKDRD